MRTIIRLQSAVGIIGRPLECDILSMYQKYKQVIFDYRNFRKTANITRAIFQDEHIKELALKRYAEACAVRKNIKRLETKRSQSRKIQTMLGNRRGSIVTKVRVSAKLSSVSSKTSIDRLYFF